MHERTILDHLILAGGPPRSGTTLLARLLSAHPRLALASDNQACESWGLYRYADYSGLVDELRHGRLHEDAAGPWLLGRIARAGWVNNITPSPFHGAQASAVADAPINGVARLRLPVEDFGTGLRLCLKSPEISFVLPRLAACFPRAQFVLVHRRVIETAESMYRKGNEWPNAYHRRWNRERDASGGRIVPADTPADLAAHWNAVSDFQRCVLRATAYLRAMAEGAAALPSDRVFVYRHARLREDPARVLAEMAAFLGVDAGGFGPAENLVRDERAEPSAAQQREFEALVPVLDLERSLATARALEDRHRT